MTSAGGWWPLFASCHDAVCVMLRGAKTSPTNTPAIAFLSVHACCHAAYSFDGTYQPSGASATYDTTLFASRYFHSPSSPRSLPKPVSLRPPQGSWQKHGWLQLFQTIPVSNASVMRASRASHLENTAAAASQRP